jgi:hypothetical protein
MEYPLDLALATVLWRFSMARSLAMESLWSGSLSVSEFQNLGQRREANRPQSNRRLSWIAQAENL